MGKIMLMSLFLFGCDYGRNFDCTKADYNKMFDYIKWCQQAVGVETCQEQAKEMFCKEIFDYRTFEKSDTSSSYNIR